MTRITDTQRKMLQRLGLARNAHFFTVSVNGYQPLSEPVAQRNLDELADEGLIYRFRDGYRLTQRGRNWMDSAVVVPCAKITNASSRSAYSPAAWTPARADADSHQQYKSIGNGPQITPA